VRSASSSGATSASVASWRVNSASSFALNRALRKAKSDRAGAARVPASSTATIWNFRAARLARAASSLAAVNRPLRSRPWGSIAT
jgi:hypothetical protein